MRIQELWDRHKDDDIFILGTGPSVRYLPIDFLKGKVVIALNQAWRYFQHKSFGPTYCLAVHTELYNDYRRAEGHPKTRWILMQKGPIMLPLNHPKIYVFLPPADEDRLACVRQRIPDRLYFGGGVHCSALNLAAHMGAKNILLVGCDFDSLAGDHHAHSQHVEFRGRGPTAVYNSYHAYAADIRRVLRGKGVNVVAVQPFLGVNILRDQARLAEELRLERLPAPTDVSEVVKQRIKHNADLPKRFQGMLAEFARELREFSLNFPKALWRAVLVGNDLPADLPYALLRGTRKLALSLEVHAYTSESAVYEKQAQASLRKNAAFLPKGADRLLTVHPLDAMWSAPSKIGVNFLYFSLYGDNAPQAWRVCRGALVREALLYFDHYIKERHRTGGTAEIVASLPPTDYSLQTFPPDERDGRLIYLIRARNEVARFAGAKA